MNWAYSPFIVPLVAFLIPIAAIVGGIWSHAQERRLRADQRMGMLARGISLAEVEAVLNADKRSEEERPSNDPLRRLNNARRTALVLMSTGAGLMLFFVVLEIILQVRPVLAGAAAGLIPFAIGVGFWIDYSMQRREMTRFGLEVEQEKMLG